jgi:threonyl-tRNA synthetase
MIKYKHIKLKYMNKNNNEKLWALRHSAEHVLTQAMINIYGDKIIMAMGPATDDGFYFDFEFNADLRGNERGITQTITPDDFPAIEAEMKKIIDENLPITKEELSISEAKKLFKDNPYKMEWLDEIENRGEKPTVYWTGNKKEETSLFVDLCAGPHIKSTGEIKAFKLLKFAGAYWHGDEKNKMLTRIYGTAYENKKELDNYLKMIEEAEKRDHKILGPQLGIFFIDETAPGMPYWLPKGTIIINELLKFWRQEHASRGYQETITPLLNKKKLYEISGHWEHYRDNMFICDMGENNVYCVKPMNCPNAMTIYQQTKHSYRELPLRLSDCDALHRHEKSGELSGLLRVQKFAQDDAHIFVKEDQITSEYKEILDIAKLFYSVFDIKFKIRLGTRPTDFMGDIETWNKAEQELEKILINNKFDYFIGEGEGAFYGPKLDILMDDCLGRQWQTGTIQLDFQLPRRFNLKYTDKDGQEKTPIVIHRVIYGSLERFIGILIENFAGAFPLWISPIQIAVISVAEKHIEHCEKLAREFKNEGIRVEIWDENETVGNKIRKAVAQKIPYLIVIGDKEINSEKLAVRKRGEKEAKEFDKKEFIEIAKKIIKEKSQEL